MCGDFEYELNWKLKCDVCHKKYSSMRIISVDRNPKSIIARAYRLGRKKMNQELIKAIETESTQPHVMMV